MPWVHLLVCCVAMAIYQRHPLAKGNWGGLDATFMVDDGIPA
jgi:hypothetical protein